MAKISREELISALAGKLGTTKKSATELLNTVTGTITEELAKGNSVRISNEFGTFDTAITKATTKFKPGTREPIQVPAKRVVKFKPSSVLKTTVNS